MRKTLLAALCSVLVLAGLLGLPAAPSPDKLISDQPLPCGAELLYVHVYDTDPATEAMVLVAGPALNGQHEHGEPFLVVVVDAAGVPTFYLSLEGRVSTLSLEQWDARFGDHKLASFCRVLAEKRA